MIHFTKEELVDELQKHTRRLGNPEWIVTSTPFGCPRGCSKVYLRRKRATWENVRVRLLLSECLPDDEAEELKERIREQLRR